MKYRLQKEQIVDFDPGTKEKGRFPCLIVGFHNIDLTFLTMPVVTRGNIADVINVIHYKDLG